MKKIKLGAVLMAALMMLSMLLTACAGSASSSTPASEPASTASSAASASTAEPTGLEWLTPFEETVTLDVVVGWDADPAVKEGTTPETNALVEVIKEKLNIELNFLWMVPNDQLEERLALQISSGEIPDILMLDSENFYEFRDSGYLRDLTQAYDTLASEDLRFAAEGFGDDPMNFASKDGELLGIPALLDTAESVAGLYYRSDWLEALDMEVPTTVEGVNEMLVALAEYGATVNGGKDTVGLGTTSNILNTNFALSAYFQMYGAYPNKWVMRDGKLVNGMVMDEMLDGLNGLKALYDSGAIATDFATWNGDQFNERVTADQVGATFGTYYIPAYPLNLNKDANPDAEWAEIDIADLDGKAKPAMNQVSLQFFNVVTKDAPENAEEALIKILNLQLASTGSSAVDKSFFEGRHLAENGAAMFMLPVYMYYPTPWAKYRENIWAAYEAKDPDSLQFDYEKELYGYMDDWLTNGNDSETPGTSWGQYKSRLVEDMGIAIGLKARETGDYEPSYFYGPATATEQRASSTLKDMSVSFIIEYIMGQKTEADWESFKQSWYDMGGEAWTSEVNEQYINITQ